MSTWVRVWMFRIAGLECLLDLVVAVIDEKEAAAIKPEAFQAVDDARESIDLAKDTWNLVCKQILTVV
jgi:hypothetical protein